ncbi:peptidoglycan-binding protein [Streptomyces sp. NBC_01077]|uniref:peptidoglycan-binding domain-containing protein n=1 Tax=Streptomyces sp. NBC_01077 TaxID=2903746 RepID=UPI00386AF291|nr:peptidoglycan-binding protein [Streptomyces sp. NBC_01077]
MTGHVCPECGVERPGCACARAELAAAEDFDPLRIRPYVTLDATEGGADGGAGGPGSYDAGRAGAYSVDSPDSYGAGSPGSHGAGSPGSHGAHADDPPTAPLAAIRLDGGPGDGGPGGAPHGGPSGGQGGAPYEGPSGGQGGAPYEGPGGDAVSYAAEAFPAQPHPGGDPSETMPLLLRGVGDIPPPPGHDRGQGRGRRRGVMIAAVAAVAVAGTAALAAAVLGGGDEPDDRAAVPEVTTSASLNLAVSEAPSPSSESPEPTSSSPTPRETSSAPSVTPSPTGTTASPSASASTTGVAAPPAASSSSAPATSSPPTTKPSTTPPPTESPGEGEEEAQTLSVGSSGHEVRELQRRLTDVGVYDGHVNGRYDDEVWEAVSLYQSYMYIQGDPDGVYGPNTREVLERYTPHI